MTLLRTGSRFIVIGVCLLAGGSTLAKTSVAGSQQLAATPVQFSPSRGLNEVFAGTPTEALADLQKGLPMVRNAHLGPTHVPGTTGTMLALDLVVSGFVASEIGEALWERDLFAGAAADRFAASGFDPIVEVSATLISPDGARQPVGGGLGRVVRDQVFVDPPTDVPFILGLAARAAQIGLTNPQVSRVHGLQDALIIRMQTGSAEATTRTVVDEPQLLTELLAGPPTAYEGVFFELDDLAGTPLFITATAPRAGTAMVWVKPEFGIPLGHVPRQDSS